MKDTLYGQFVVGTPIPVTSADHILGVHVSCDNQGRPDFVDLQYRSVDGTPVQQMRMDFVNAMFLLSLLKSMQLDSGVQFPDDPRAKR